EPVPYAKLDNPQSLNLYEYALNNPLTGVDNDGHSSDTGCGVDGKPAPCSFNDKRTNKPQNQQQQSNEIAGQINHETLGMKDSKTENESLASAEGKIAHVRLNGIKKWG